MRSAIVRPSTASATARGPTTRSRSRMPRADDPRPQRAVAERGPGRDARRRRLGDRRGLLVGCATGERCEARDDNRQRLHVYRAVDQIPSRLTVSRARTTR
ncbi:MAG: hypothetical protein AVDCRST_MAG67-3813 [uncultured Solirubrobacteraceae bacterium]|uniref:Uncharacterized protein n=1 Tax=uncultured Solirubrobacteraceae bacterium TaxID=1162706 RepID=A0A6J4TGL6_9ACTN|nr:MAG: hypothetical protein AVDCRST_MAG67-3813 [uncultured Solirubrobacteraceae bacterium]